MPRTARLTTSFHPMGTGRQRANTHDDPTPKQPTTCVTTTVATHGSARREKRSTLAGRARIEVENDVSNPTAVSRRADLAHLMFEVTSPANWKRARHRRENRAATMFRGHPRSFIDQSSERTGNVFYKPSLGVRGDVGEGWPTHSVHRVAVLGGCLVAEPPRTPP